jgi:hypothetical protein
MILVLTLVVVGGTLTLIGYIGLIIGRWFLALISLRREPVEQAPDSPVAQVPAAFATTVSPVAKAGRFVQPASRPAA